MSRLEPSSYKIFLEDMDLLVDIGLHDFEIGTPQRLRVNVEIGIDPSFLAKDDKVDEAWDYDFIPKAIRSLASGRRFMLQETFCRAVYDEVAARAEVNFLRVSTRKLDVYPDCKSVGVELSSLAAE